MFDHTSNDNTAELAKLHILQGADFIRQLKNITQMGVFQLVEEETNIYTAGSEFSADYDNLLCVAQKAVEYGFTVYILPNPNEIRTADFIFERKGVYKIFDLKTVSGKSSVGNRLLESIGQTNRVLLNITVDYNIRHLATDVRHYYEASTTALEVLIFKGNKNISITRNLATSKGFVKMLIKKFR